MDLLKEYSLDELVNICKEQGFMGFSGEVCPYCERSMNILWSNIGYTCPRCKKFWGSAYATKKPLLENPDYGPNKRLILSAYGEIHDTKQMKPLRKP